MRREQKHLPNADRITIKKNKKTNITKFKLRTPKYLLTLKVDDKNKAEKIMQSIPPSKWQKYISDTVYNLDLKKETKNWAMKEQHMRIEQSSWRNSWIANVIHPKDLKECISLLNGVYTLRLQKALEKAIWHEFTRVSLSGCAICNIHLHGR